MMATPPAGSPAFTLAIASGMPGVGAGAGSAAGTGAGAGAVAGTPTSSIGKETKAVRQQAATGAERGFIHASGGGTTILSHTPKTHPPLSKSRSGDFLSRGAQPRRGEAELAPEGL